MLHRPARLLLRFYCTAVLLISLPTPPLANVRAQDVPLVAIAPQVTHETDIYGQAVPKVRGSLVNTDENAAYTAISLSALAFDPNDQEIGAGFGYLVKACGQALVPDFALQPGAAQAFELQLELDDPALQVAYVEVTAEGLPQEPLPAAPPSLQAGLTVVSHDEVGRVEWVDGENLRYGLGCGRALFTDNAWQSYDLRTGVQQAITHPKAELVTPTLRQALKLTDEVYFRHSLLTFHPNGRRLLYQTDLNGFITAEPDGSFKRVLFERMADRSLQTITWFGADTFVAAYFGAYGDPVTYFSATAQGRLLSETPQVNPPSEISPGASPDGQRLVIGTTVEGQTGYYLKRAAYPGLTLLFEAELPGNNWPPPLWEQDADGVAFLYVAVPVRDHARLRCYNFQTQTLHDQIALPLMLEADERATWQLAPDNNTIALAADGLHGGLWTLDLAKLPPCG